MKAVYKLHEEQQQYDIEQFYTFYVMKHSTNDQHMCWYVIEHTEKFKSRI